MDKSIQDSNKFNYVNLKSRRRIFTDNLIGGLAWGVGSVVGATVIVSLFAIIVYRSQNIPLVGEIFKVIENEIEEARENTLIKINEEVQNN